MKQRGFYLYAAIGVVLLVVLAYGLYERGNAANARADAAEKRAATLAAEVTQANETIEALQVAAKVLDEQLVKIHQREDTLNAQKRALQKKLDELAKQVSAADQACLGRDLPDAFVERLLNDRSAGKKDGKAEGPGSSASPVREDRPRP